MKKIITSISFLLLGLSTSTASSLKVTSPGSGLPQKIQLKQGAVDYLQEFINQEGIKSVLNNELVHTDNQIHGIHKVDSTKPFTGLTLKQWQSMRQSGEDILILKRLNSSRGVGLVSNDSWHSTWQTDLGETFQENTTKRGEEHIFYNNISRAEYKRPVKTGRDFLNTLESYSSEVGCIPKVTFGGHGSGSLQEANYLNTQGKYRGPIVINTKARQEYIRSIKTNEKIKPEHKKYNQTLAIQNTVSIYDTLNPELSLHHRIQSKRINFCNRCLIQIHSCNTSTYFANNLAVATGCQVVVPTGRVNASRHDNDGRGDTYWLSGDFEKGVGKSEGKDSFYRVTPINHRLTYFEGQEKRLINGRIRNIRTQRMAPKVDSLVKENIGSIYISY